MSLPKQVHLPSYSSSPSKSSLRSQKSGQQPRSLLPSPHFEDNPEAEVHTVEAQSIAEEDLGGDPQDSEQDVEAEHNFQPFFTLLYDNQTSEHHHPTVHYIFADDDTDIITEAALRSLEPDDDGAAYTEDPVEPTDEHGVREAKLQSPQPQVKEHYILLDLARTPTSQPETHPSASSENVAQPTPLDTSSEFPYQVLSASSLSPSFALVSADISTAPTFESPVTATAQKRRSASIIAPETQSSAQTQAQGLGIYNGSVNTPNSTATAAASAQAAIEEGHIPEDGPFMLKIHGISAFNHDSPHATPIKPEGSAKQTTAAAAEAQSPSLEELVGTFEERLAEIRSVINNACTTDIAASEGPAAEGSTIPPQHPEDLASGPEDKGSELDQQPSLPAPSQDPQS